MGYNACYGLPLDDSMTMEPVETKHTETLNFLETDVCGNHHVKREYACCDVCGAKLKPNETAYQHLSYLYCEKCEKQHRLNERLKKKIGTKKTTNKVNKKAVTK